MITQPQIAVFSESVVNGLLNEKYTFVYSVDSINFLQHEQLGTVITEEAFNEHPVRISLSQYLVYRKTDEAIVQ